MDINELMQKKERLKHFESLLASYKKGDQSVYELILKEMNHPPVNFFMIETAVKELETKIEEYKTEISQSEKFIDNDINAKSK